MTTEQRQIIIDFLEDFILNPTAEESVSQQDVFDSFVRILDGLNQTKAELIAGKVPESMLPPVNLMPYFNRDQFGLVGGLITDIRTGIAIKLSAPVIALYGVNTETTIGIQWSAVDHATGYDIYRLIGSSKTKIGTTAGLNYINTGLTPGTEYQHFVKAITVTSGYTESDFSNGLTSSTAAASGSDYVPVTTEWVPAGSFSRTGNTITYIEQGRAISTLTLPQGVAGAVRFSSADAALILSTNESNYDGFSEAMYGAIRNPVNLKVQAFSHTDTELNIETGSIDPAPSLEIEITNTGGAGNIGEIIWLHDGIEWARDERVSGSLTIKSFGYNEGFLSVEQKGFA